MFAPGSARRLLTAFLLAVVLAIVLARIASAQEELVIEKPGGICTWLEPYSASWYFWNCHQL